MEREYLDFDISVEAIDDDRYRARVVDSPAGQSSAEFTLPFTMEGLENFVLKMGRPRARVRRFGSPQTEEAQRFGAELHGALFSGDVGTCFLRSLDEAERQQAGLRLRLRLTEAPDLGQIPWEFLYSESLGRFITLSNQTPLVRFIELPNQVRPLEVEPPLRILTVLSDPTDAPVLDVQRERQLLQEATSDLVRRGALELHILEDATMSALQHAVRREDFHILHFMGHGGFDERVGDGVLVMEDDAGRAQPVSGHDLGMLLHDSNSLRLAVLNACEGARTGAADPFGGVAQSLIRQGIPAVVAMQFEVTDTAAVQFAHELYLAIADGYPIDAATVEARKGVFASSGDVEWGTPVLYLRASDGQIFDIAEVPKTPDVDTLMSDAQRLVDAGDTLAAIGVTDRILSLHPDHREAEGLAAELRTAQRVDELWERAQSLADTDPDAAYRLLGQLILLAPSHTEASEMLATLTSATGTLLTTKTEDTEEPRRETALATDREPPPAVPSLDPGPGDQKRQVADAELARARRLMSDGDFAGAQRAINGVLEVFPDDEDGVALFLQIPQTLGGVDDPDLSLAEPAPAEPPHAIPTQAKSTQANSTQAKSTQAIPIQAVEPTTPTTTPTPLFQPLAQDSTAPTEIIQLTTAPATPSPPRPKISPLALIGGVLGLVIVALLLLRPGPDEPTVTTVDPESVGTGAGDPEAGDPGITVAPDIEGSGFDWIAEFPSGHQIVPLLVAAPTIDGSGDDWPSVPTYLSEHVVFGTDTGVRANWMLGWDDTALYVFAEVNDPAVRQRHSGAPAFLFRGDSVSFEYSPSPHRPGRTDLVRDGDLHVMLGPADGIGTELASVNIARDGGFPAGGRESGITVASTLTGEGYTIEASAPWGILHPADPKVGLVVAMNLNVSDATTDDQLAMMASNNPDRTAQTQPMSGIWFRTILWDAVGFSPKSLPKVVGLDIGSAESALQDAGFDVHIIPACSNSMSPGLARQVFVSGTSPESIVADIDWAVPGLPEGTALTIKESTGPC